MYIYEKEVIEKDEDKIPSMYDRGFVLTRKGEGVMQKIQSLRVFIKDFSLSSENRRVLRKIPNLGFEVLNLPLLDYDWNIHAMGKTFYSQKFGKNTMSANKIKDIVKNKKTSFNTILKFNTEARTVGYCICFLKDKILHYAYPFYDTEYISMGLGIGMMTKTIEYAKDENMEYVYLGSVYKRESLYKLQFKGEEWFFEDKWNTDIPALKNVLRDKT